MVVKLFYKNDVLQNLVSGDCVRSLVRTARLAHVEHQTEGRNTRALMMATSQSGSVLLALDNNGVSQVLKYMAYGGFINNAVSKLTLAFNGEWQESLTEAYFLGNGQRLFSPRLMRFYSPDNSSPFGAGLINSYAYCIGDPVNKVDRNGHAPLAVSGSMEYFKGVFLKKTDNPELGKARKAVMRKYDISKLPKLEDSQPDEYEQYLDVFRAKGDVSASSFDLIAGRKDVENIRGAYKFVFTSRLELIVGDERGLEFAHPMLNYFSSGGDVVSAGYIYWKKGQLYVSDYSGHYYLSAAGRETAAPVITFLGALGVKAKAIRSHGSMPG